MTTTVRIPERPDNPHRLGRHVAHDPRSARYAVAGAPTSTLVSRRWTRRIPVLDQGDLGSCTGNAAAGWLGTDNAIRQGVTTVDGVAVDEAYAVQLYSAATRLDDIDGDYPPTDTGSDGLSVAKALQAAGIARGYQHAFSLQATLTALATAGPVLLGTVWLQAMFEPAKDGRLTPRGAVAGGHEYLADEIDVERRRVWITNSWAESWGIGGRAYLTWDDLATLLDQQGDVTVPTPVQVPAPTPTPTPPTPGPVQPDSPDDALADALGPLVPAAEAWLAAYSSYRLPR
ncbi:hypothetical protein [Frankia sp. AgB32]|uniref:hypothetical protein n=1 Tax=Frankia sp. AgB32 TaxID=631119 RepID=UPI00200F0A7F|nr:hypothetical protein [Frankia sp. AgB32]MCK9896987.1 hypothetical protein [Frankia sp. AgB32]